MTRIAAVVFAALLGSAAIATDLAPRHIRTKPQHSRIGPGLREDLLIVKFRDAAQVRLRVGRLVSLTGTPVQSANLLTADTAGLAIERLLRRPEAQVDHSREQAQSRSGRQLADLNGYFAIRLAAPDRVRAEALLDALNALDVVEIAYAEPVPEYAAIVGKSDRVHLQGGTPDFAPLQDYHDPAPTGIHVAAAWALPGGHGEGVRIIDVELGYRWTHEDMPAPFFEGGPNEDADHGVAVLGEIAAPDNGFGVTGIAHGAQVGSRHTGDVPTAVAFDEAAANVSPGDFVVIELQAAGPTPGGGVTVVPLEYYQANFDVIETATASGVIFVAAAGNGSADLDHAVFDGLFDRDVRDSGAILVGATAGASLVPAGFSNYGSRVDLSGWGADVVTTGYGDLQGGNSNVWYTASFGGTSSATPIVTGALAVLQGIYRDGSGGVPAPGRTLAEMLIATGTPTVGSQHIGPRPNLALAIPALQAGLADLSGTVRDQATTLPLQGALVRVLESGAQVLTAADGTWDLRFVPGSFTVRVSTFGYMPFDYAVNVAAGGADDRNVNLSALPTSVVSGRAVGQAGNGLANVEVRLVDAPLPAVLTNGAGDYAIPGVPAGFQGLAHATRADLTPDVREVSTVLGPASVSFRLIPPQKDFEADNGGFAGSGEWEWGVPTYPQGPQAHGGMRLWGTDLDDTYAAVNQSLSFTVDVPDQSPRLAYWHWHDVWGPYDGIRVEISDNGGATFVALPPVGGYDEPCVWDFGVPCAPAWSFRSEGWIPGVHDLEAYAGEQVVIRLRLQASGFGTGAGWYIDDLAVFEDVDIVDTSVCVEIALDLPSTDPHLSLRRPDDCPTGGVLPAEIDLISGNVVNLKILGGAVRLGPITQIACADTSQAHLVVSLAPPPAGETRFFLAREVSQTHYGTSSSGLPRLAGPGGCP